MDQQTKAALKQDKFVDTTTHGLEWASAHRQSLLRTGGIVLAVILILAGGGLLYASRADKAAVAFGAAMQTYETPLARPGEPVPPGVTTFASSAERAKAANAQFLDIANHHGMTPQGENALYFAGLTYADAGQNQQAEDTLKKVSGSWSSNISALGKFALAQLYRNTGRDPQAIDLYNQLSAKPTTTVPYGVTRLQLADLYEQEGKKDEAKKVYADLADKDAKGPAGMIAKQKLNPAPAVPRLGMAP